MRRLFWCLMAFFLTCSLYSQTPLQTLRGRVSDAQTLQPLAGATVQLRGTSSGVVTDSAGIYRLEGLQVGRYTLEVSYLGYQTQVVAEVLLSAGRETILDIALSPASATLAEVVVTGAPIQQGTHDPSVRLVSNEATLRLPATFFDPARQVMTFPGVAGDNDQANGVSVRGNFPNGLLWRLEGADIVNPNHTPNAGTVSDRVTANGGGVIILSAQLLDNSSFYSGAFPAGFGNALGGVMDMRLRPGNNQQTEFTLQTGLIGLDAAAEGPFRTGSQSSFLVNYRYSTIGLLSALGLELGDEDISFQDLSFNLNFPGKKGSLFTLFGLGGISRNLFEAQRDSSLWEFSKDRYDIDFRSRMGATGMTYTHPLGARGSWRTVLAASGLGSERIGNRLDEQYQSFRESYDLYNQSKINLHSVIRYQFKPGAQLNAGVQVLRQGYDLSSEERDVTIAEGQTSHWLLQPYVSGSAGLGKRIRAEAGLHALFFSLNNAYSLEPRLTLKWQSTADQQWRMAYGLHSQIQQPQLYFANLGTDQEPKLSPTRAHHVVLGYQYQFSALRTLDVQAYYQQLFDVPISAQRASSFSALNLVETFITEPLRNDGTGQNYGLELSFQQFWQKGIYYLLNGSVYRSLYKGSDDLERSTRFDGNFILNLTAGKEWLRPKAKQRARILGINARFNARGGFRDTPIDPVVSGFSGRTIYREEQAFSIRQPAYYRLDTRIYWKWNRPGFTGTLSLDIQNLSNRQNLAFSYFDTQQNQVVEKYQLGIIPILNYRMEF